MLKTLSSMFFIFTLASCAGYKIRSRSNPFAKYGVDSVAIPQFYNHTPLNGASAYFTDSITKLLLGFGDLKVYSGKNTKADAVLVGVLDGNNKKTREILRRTDDRSASSYDDNLSDKREDFLIPTSSTVEMRLRIILIKNPSEQDLKLLNSDLGDKVQSGNKVIFQESVAIRSRFSREIYGEDNSVINGTQNLGILQKSLQVEAENAANQFRDIILYAF